MSLLVRWVTYWASYAPDNLAQLGLLTWTQAQSWQADVARVMMSSCWVMT